MTSDTPDDFEIFLSAPPGLESALHDEVRLKGFRRPRAVPGGVVLRGGWPDAWRANLWVRGAGRVLARVAAFRAVHMAQLDDLARRVPWNDLLRADTPFRVEASCAGSRLYHSGAVAQRIETAIRDTTGAPHDPGTDPGHGVAVMARVENDLCTLSVDTSGEPLHKRGHKEAVNAAPMRETMAALMLQQCGFRGEEPLVDPMCGSGTFVIEAAAIAARLNPGRDRHFAFERLRTFDPAEWARMRAAHGARAPAFRCFGHDRDAGAVAMSRANAERAGVAGHAEFRQGAISDLRPPDGPPGLVIVNPPYGHRLGDRESLAPLYGAMGRVLRERFRGWRIGLVAADPRLAGATALPFVPPGPPVPHGGLRVTLFRTAPLD